MRNSLLASAVITLAATNASQAALVSVSQIVTNNTLTTQTYNFSDFSGLGVLTAPAYMRGSISIALSDFNRDGAILSADSGMLYTAWIDSVKVQSMPNTLFTLVTPARGGNTYTNNFGWVYLNSSLPSSTGIEMRLNFRLSPGDQVAISGTFEVSSVPTPAGAAMLLAAAAGFRRRRYA
jgi:hypothetical protein